MSSGQPTLRRVGPVDIPDLLPLSVEPGWNQVAEDWRLMIDHGDAFGCADADGRIVASGLTVEFGAPFAWISMILVTARWRRRGLATRLMETCIEALRSKGLTPALDASPEGREVYGHLDFRDVYRTTRLLAPTGSAVGKGETATDARVRPADETDLARIAAYDAQPFGGDRAYMLEHLQRRLPQAAHLAERGSQVVGYVLARPGRQCSQIGPLVADDPNTAHALLSAALSSTKEAVCLDLGDHHGAIKSWLESIGFTPVVPFIRMIQSRAKPFDDPERVFVIAGPELG